MTRAVTLAEIADTNTFVVDGTNVRVGINSSIPTTTLDVGGAVKATSFTGNVTGNATGLTGTPDIAVRNITGVAATFTGVLTYEDVTNIDSVGIITARSDVSIADKIIHTGDTNTAIRFPAADTFTVETAGSERLRIDSSGRLLAGPTSSRSVGDQVKLQIEGTDQPTSSLSATRNSANAAGPSLSFGKSRGSSVGSNTVVQDDDLLGNINFFGADGTDANTKSASIQAFVDGTPGSNDMPGRLVFSTTADGAASPTTRLTIKSDAKFGFNTANPPRDYCFSSGQADTNIQITNSTTGVDDSAGTLIQQDGNDLYIWNKENSFMSLGTNATERVRITSAGNIGIGGLTNPQDYHANANSLVSSGGITLANTSGGYIYFADSATGTGEYVGQIGYDHSSDYMNFVVNNGERLRIQSGGGISFNGDTAAANALDDYEEGTWLPNIGGTAVYDIQWGYYIKIGKSVQCWGGLRPSSMGTGNARHINNLPFTAIASPNTTMTGGGAIVWHDNCPSSITNTPAIAVHRNTTNCNINAKNAASTTLGDNVDFWQNNHRANFFITYQTN